VKTIPLTRGAVAIVDDRLYTSLSKNKWYLGSDGYAVRNDYSNGRDKPIKFRMHRVVLGLKKGQICDHKNGNRLDNRRSNLRQANDAQNRVNAKLNRNNTTGCKGVYLQHGKFRVRIGVAGKILHVGMFADAIKARAARVKAEKHHFGEFARAS
jgi:hypothetical protein